MYRFNLAPVAQRTFASSVPSSFVTQQQLTQTELNAAPQNLLTANDIAAAIARLPNPIVSVQQIEYVTAQKKAVEVRANI